MTEDCQQFQADNAELLAQVGTIKQHGHDFWLTRNGHGAGFWDRGYGEIGRKLTDAAHAWGSSDIYIGDDGKLYIS
jgi:NAD/NADP transhydrogenase alpha subunit